MSDLSTLTIATRESPLAMWQAKHIQTLLLRQYPALRVEILGMTTRGDQILDSPLAKIGGKGLFIKELETALLDGRADLAVHSCKDMPAELPDGLKLVIVDQRETPFDALVLPGGNPPAEQGLMSLPDGAVVGTSSLRRKCQILKLRPDITCRDLRGNVNTRLAKLDAGDYDAIVLAAAGLQRLGMQDRISQLIPSEELLPAVGQGVLAIELRADDEATMKAVAQLIHQDTSLCVAAERAMNARLEGGCQVPIAGYAERSGNRLLLRGRVGAVDGSELLNEEQNIDLSNCAEPVASAVELGHAVAERLLKSGAERLLRDLSE